MSWTSVKIHDETFEDTVIQLLSETIAWLSMGTGTRIFRATSDTPVTPDLALLADDGTTRVARAGDTFSSSRPNAYLTARTVKKLSPTKYEIVATYKDPTGGLSSDDLLALPAQVSSTGLNGTEEYSMDFHDTPLPVRNAAGEPFDHLPTKLSAGRVYTIVKYVSDSTKTAIQAAEHTNNSSSITIDGFVCPEDTLLLNNAAFEVVQDFHRVTLTVTYNPNLWVDKMLDVGFSEIDEDGHRKDITQKDSAGNDVPVPKPWPLNSDGTKKSSSTDTIDVLTFYEYPQADWSGVPVA